MATTRQIALTSVVEQGRFVGKTWAELWAEVDRREAAINKDIHERDKNLVNGCTCENCNRG